VKLGLSLRTSQHLSLTPQLQQSIRLLQLSTLELSQEVEQALDENPFLERETDEAVREEFGLAQSDSPVDSSASNFEFTPDSIASEAINTPATFDNAHEITVNSSTDDIAESISTPNDWDGDGSVDISPDDSEWGGDATASMSSASQNSSQNNSESTLDATELARQQESLTMHLHRQALALRLSELDSAALRYLIESLNDDGYLEDSLPSLAQSLGDPNDIEQQDELVHRFTVALHLLQSLEPTGVGARDLSECLSLQVKAKLNDLNIESRLESDKSTQLKQTCQTALSILKQPIDLLARRDLKKLMQLCRESEANIKDAIALIAHLEPKPGRVFADVQRNIIVPDVFVVPLGRSKPGAEPQFRAQLNSDIMPKLKVHDIYANALKNFKGEGASGAMALQQRLQEARWFIKSIQQRFDTILRVSNAIIERQKGFLMHGELAMRPLVLRDIADELGLHESTISRVTTAKYMSTPFGTYELKYFFGSGLSTEGGSNASSTAVRALIKQFVAAENPKKPLSDNKIAAMLKEQGIDCARRTVAKYRDALKIAPTNLRKLL
jgi:RNA polymerase sigma-54 factor